MGPENHFKFFTAIYFDRPSTGMQALFAAPKGKLVCLRFFWRSVSNHHRYFLRYYIAVKNKRGHPKKKHGRGVGRTTRRGLYKQKTGTQRVLKVGRCAAAAVQGRGRAGQRKGQRRGQYRGCNGQYVGQGQRRGRGRQRVRCLFYFSVIFTLVIRKTGACYTRIVSR